MVRFMAGLIGSMDPVQMTYTQKAERLLECMEELGITPPQHELIDPIFNIPVLIEGWENEQLQ